MNRDVIIIGAGAAGAGAAAVLATLPLSVLLLEADDRVGGRALTETRAGMALDLGCGWLHSAERNPLANLFARSGLMIDHARSAWYSQYRDLGFAAGELSSALAAWRGWQKRLAAKPMPTDRLVDALAPDERWAEFIRALSSYTIGAALERVSTTDYLAYQRASTAENWRVREGYGHAVAGLLADAPIRLTTPVSEVVTEAEGVRVATQAGTLRARAAILTVSTDVLASGVIRLERDLDEHCHAASRLPLGLANKYFFEIEGSSPFEAETHVIGDPHRRDTGSYYLRPFGLPVIEAFFGGPGALALERDGAAAGFDFAITELSALFGGEVRRHLRPLVCSQWSREPLVRGSYSYALPGESGQRAILARPHRERLFFAGEATHSSDFSTAHGAFESGARAAGEVAAALRVAPASSDSPNLNKTGTC